MNRTKRSPLFLMALTIFIDFAGFGVVLPLLPFWAERLGAGPVGVGLVLTIYALAQFIFTPALGALSDRYGRRPIIIASLLIEALSLALSAVAGSLAILLIARFIGGLGASNIGSAQAVVADVTPVERRAQGMGLIGAAIGLGFVVGPALGGLLAPRGAGVPFWVAMIVALANALLVLRFLPETRHMQTTTRASTPPNTAPAPVVSFTNRGMGVLLSGSKRVLRNPAVARLVIINLLFTVAFTAMEAVFPLFTQHSFGWTALQNGYISALLSFASPPTAQGETLGLAQGVAGLGRVIGPLAAGSIFAIGGPGAPFILGSALVALAALIALPALSQASKRVSLTHSAPDVQPVSTARDGIS